MACVWHHRLLQHISWLWRAGSDDRELAELEEHIEILSRVAAELRERGRGQEFAEVARETEELKGRRDHEREVAEDQRSKYASHIFAAIETLHELGRPENARRLLDFGQTLRPHSW